MEGEVAPPVSERHAEDDRCQIADGDRGIDHGLLVALHRNEFRDEIYFDGDYGHGDGVIQHDDAPFARRRDQFHLQQAHDHIADAPFHHRTRKRAEDGGDQRDHRNGDQRKPARGAEEIIETVFEKLHIHSSKINRRPLTADRVCQPSAVGGISELQPS